LARALGSLGQAVILQQLHYWLNRATKKHDGKPWVYKTYAEWGSETCQTQHQARRAMETLRKLGLVVGIRNPYNAIDKTIWWTIDYATVAKLREGVPVEVAATPVEVAATPVEVAPAPQQYQRLHTQTTDTDSVQTLPTANAHADELEQSLTEAQKVGSQRLEAFIDRRLAERLGKVEYRDDDLMKVDWLESFQSLHASDEDFRRGLDAAFERNDADWRRRLQGPKAAQAFVGEFPRLLPKRDRLQPFLTVAPGVLGE
jgi:hypothetical protein